MRPYSHITSLIQTKATLSFQQFKFLCPTETTLQKLDHKTLCSTNHKNNIIFPYFISIFFIDKNGIHVPISVGRAKFPAFSVFLMKQWRSFNNSHWMSWPYHHLLFVRNKKLKIPYLNRTKKISKPFGLNIPNLVVQTLKYQINYSKSEFRILLSLPK